MNPKICDCTFTDWCHEARQTFQNKMREETNTTVENCWFYKEIEKATEMEERKMNTAIVSGHIYYDSNHKDIEILTKVDDEEVYTGVFDDIDHALIDNIDIGESEDYYFIAIIKSKFVSYYTCDGEEWEVEHEVKEIKNIDDFISYRGKISV